MTDIEKEGELFEQWWEDEGQYHRAGGDDYCKTFAWEAWIFAKNKTIPDGFVVVPKEPTPKMIDAGMGNFCFPLDNGRFYNHDLIFAYRAMIEAQEQTND